MTPRDSYGCTDLGLDGMNKHNAGAIIVADRTNRQNRKDWQARRLLNLRRSTRLTRGLIAALVIVQFPATTAPVFAASGQLLIARTSDAAVLAGVAIAAVPPGVPAAAAAAPAPVTVNRMVPRVSSPPARAQFSAQPTDAEFFRARIFSEPLVPIGRATTPAENVALAQALQAYSGNTASSPSGSATTASTLNAWPMNVSPFIDFLATHRDSPWRASLLVQLGSTYMRGGYSHRALDAWNDAWQIAKEATSGYGRTIADQALAEWSSVAVATGRHDEVRQRLEETRARQIPEPTASKIARVHERLSLLFHKPHRLATPEQRALERIAAVHGKAIPRHRGRVGVDMTGRSWSATIARAARLGMSMRAAKRSGAASFPIPALVQMKAGHVIALLERRIDQYLVHDPMLAMDRWIRADALDEEATDYVLIPRGRLPSGFTPAAAAAMSAFTGMCPPGPADDNEPPCPGTPDAGPGGAGGGDEQNVAASGPQGEPGDGGPSGQDAGSCKSDECKKDITGLATYALRPCNAALLIDDIPVGYTPSRGPDVYFHVRYNQRASYLPTIFPFSNLGPNWTHEWLSYVEDIPLTCSPWGDCVPAHARLTPRGGGWERYHPSGPNTFYPHWRHRAELVRVSTSPLRFERHLRDGSVEVYGLSDGAPAGQAARVFLTQITDPSGQSITLTYDVTFRLVAITDALGQVTTIAYEHPSDPLKITKVTDPFGRSATFEYASTGTLSRIADVIGMSSAFHYAGDGFLDRLTTPYGTTTFRKETNWQTSAYVRHIEAVDPLGGVERVEYHTFGPIPAVAPTTDVPTGFASHNVDLDKFVSMYWSKRAMATAPGDPQAATSTTWLAENNFDKLWLAVSIPRVIKRPLEGRVWFEYQDQDPSNGEPGSFSRPTKVARVLDDGSSQIRHATFNARGLVASRTDPLGRRTSYTYAPNGIDPIEIRQTTGSLNDLLGVMSNYTLYHLPQTIVDAAGQTTTFTYNSHGRVLTVTNAKSETTSYTYDPGGSGRLQGATGPAAGATTTYTYDSYGRVRTSTNSDGDTTTLDYDLLGRLTRITYADTSYDELTYDKLDLTESRDRLGRRSRYVYDPLRRLVAARDPSGRTITQQWCVCGSLDAVIDGKGQVTKWQRDLQGRVTRETRADGPSETVYAYESATSRLRSITDPKLQVATYTYNLDNTVQSVAYTSAAVATPGVSYTYDGNYLRAATRVDGTGTTTMTYHPPGALGAGQVATVDGPLANDTVTYSFDELGRVTSRGVNGVNVTFGYDVLGRLITESSALGSVGYGYDGVSDRLSSMSYPNGQSSVYAYFPALGGRRLQTIHHKRAGGATLSRFDYEYDSSGNVKIVQHQADGASPTLWKYAYDAADQLVAAVQSSTGSSPTVLKRYGYAYDLAGNRTSEQTDDAVTAALFDRQNRLVQLVAGGTLQFKGTISEPATVTVDGQPALVDANGNFSAGVRLQAGTQLVTVRAADPSGNLAQAVYEVDALGPSTTLIYDANGNLAQAGGRTYEWDARNQLLAVTNGDHRSEYQYDGLQRRIRTIEKVGGVTQSDTQALWCGGTICEERSTSGGSVSRRVVPGGEQVLSAVRYFAMDRLGSVSDVTDSGGTLLARYQYDPYGRRERTAGTGETTAGYTGHGTDAASGLVLARYRAYDPAIGRWISGDPLGLWGGANYYAYVSNNPLAWTDLDGLAQDAPRPPPNIPIPDGWGPLDSWKRSPSPRPDGRDKWVPSTPRGEGPGGSRPQIHYDPADDYWTLDDGKRNRSHWENDGRRVPPSEVGRGSRRPPSPPPPPAPPEPPTGGWWTLPWRLPPVPIIVSPCLSPVFKDLPACGGCRFGTGGET